MKKSQWPDLFTSSMEIIEEVNTKYQLDIRNLSFGGGTALMIQIDHRESYDVDLFITDPQYLPYLNPFAQDFSLTLFPNEYDSLDYIYLKLSYDDIGEVDFICSQPLTNQPTTQHNVLNKYTIEMETPAEIIAKKIVYRGSEIKHRDVFDIACVCESHGMTYLEKNLIGFKEECNTALNVINKSDKNLSKTIMKNLNAHEKFLNTYETAYDTTKSLLENVVNS